MNITNDIRYIGVNDHEVDLFEGQYIVPNGMAYNSYVILDDKIAVMDTVDGRFGAQWLANLAAVLDGRKPDYLVVQHMEPDHSANIASFAAAYPEAKIVSSAKAFVMMKQFYGENYPDRQVVVGEGSTLELGRHTLSFVAAPMVHWPEVIMTYDSADKVLFSADGFGKFGALDVEEDWACEARRAGHSDHLPAARTGPERKSGVLSGPVQHLVLLQAGKRGRFYRLRLHLRPHHGRRERAGRHAGGQGRQGQCDRPGPGRYGRGCGRCVPL